MRLENITTDNGTTIIYCSGDMNVREAWKLERDGFQLFVMPEYETGEGYTGARWELFVSVDEHENALITQGKVSLDVASITPSEWAMYPVEIMYSVANDIYDWLSPLELDIFDAVRAMTKEWEEYYFLVW